ncbi:MAG: gamma-glutamyltransferase [Rhodospirillales bacterium]|nr:gamma-glutamyltransferase [Rhodospirillales bacterium]MBO6785832.1 gamma-glutamyltransferase [Rhodospirillales bacterium]
MTVVSLFLLASVSVLASCSAFEQEQVTPKGTIGYVSGALGVVSVEEPQAALIGRDVLSSGGTAGDAATAIGLALSVTMPSSAGLGGGGICVARDAGGERPVVVDFLPHAPRTASHNTERPSAVPATPRGLFLLHSRFGELRWSQVVSRAENLARFGYNIPRAFATELSKVADVLVRDPQMAEVFKRKDGRVVGEGDFLKQPDLAAVLGRLRAKGAGDFYIGKDAQNFVDAVVAAGGSLSYEDIRNYQPQIRAPLTFKWQHNTDWHFAGPPAAGGAVAAEMMAILLTDEFFEDEEGAQREHLIVEAAKRAFVERMKNLQADGSYSQDPQSRLGEDYVENLQDRIGDAATPLSSLIPTPADWPETPAAVSFSVMDTRGGAVACTMTMNNLFGTGRMAQGYGIVLAAAPDTRGRTFTPLGPALLTSELNNRVFGAAAASGGVTAPTSLANVMARVASGPQSLSEAMRAPRTHYQGVPDKVFVEADMPEDVVENLRKRGHDVVLTKSIGRVTAVLCPDGVPNKDGIQCSTTADPRGSGIALGGN